jgi:hypothetical protein
MTTLIKGDQENRYFGIDWEEELEGDTISVSVWEVPAGLTASGESFDNTKSAVRLQGGTPGERYNVTNLITTAGRQETLEATLRIRVVADRYVE